MGECLNVLLSSAGRRVELLSCIRADLQYLGIDGKVVATDASPLTPAGLLSDALEEVPRADDESYLDVLAAIVEDYDIGLIIPTIDPELGVLSDAASMLRGLGARVAGSGPEALAVSLDKAETHRFLLDNDLQCPMQWSRSEAEEEASFLPYPVIVKPRCGSSSIGVEAIDGPAELAVRLTDDSQIIESRATGHEYTSDVWVDRSGRVRSIVPRRRIATRSGEVSKGVTLRHPEVIETVCRTAEALPDAYGPLTIQCFADGGAVQVIEINARFGGGYPLSWQAGARTIRWAIQDALNWPLTPDEFAWQEELTMLRYDQSLFVANPDS